MRRIGIIGFEFESPNKGCEALSYSFIGLLKETLKNERIEILLLNGDPLGRLPEHYPDIRFKNVPYGMRDLKFRYIRAIKSCDIIFDVTMGDSFSDIYSKSFCLWLIKTKRRMEIFGKKYVLLPQTYGPFYDKIVRKKAIRVINKADLVISRDQPSINYLKEIGVKKKISREIDLAFLLTYDKSKYKFETRKIKIGLNVSGLLWRGGFYSSNQFDLKLNYREFIRTVIARFSESDDYELHLIPHVIDAKDNPYDDDYHQLEELHNSFPTTVLAPAFGNPIDAKSYISNMDCFIGSRMHSTVAAISSGVAVIPVSYSRKFEGLFGSLGYDYIVHGKEDDTIAAINKTIKWVEQYTKLKSRVNETKKIIEKDCEHLRNTFKVIMSKI